MVNGPDTTDWRGGHPRRAAKPEASFTTVCGVESGVEACAKLAWLLTDC